MGTPQLADLVQETANAPGTGAFTLGGAPAGRQTFADAFPAGGEVFYYASDGTQTEWGIGTLQVGSPNVLTRTTVLGNLFGSKTALNFSSSVMIWNEVPSGRMAFQDDAGQLPVSDSPDFTKDVALSAKVSDARYTQKNWAQSTFVQKGITSDDYAPTAAGVQKSTGRLWLSYTDDSGTLQYADAPTAAELSSKADQKGGNALTGNQSISGGGTFRVASTLDGSSMFIGMDGSTPGQAIMVVENPAGAITNVLRLDGSDLGISPGTNFKAVSAVDGSFCRLTMDGSTGTMADLILVNPSGAIANVLRLMSDGTASINQGQLAVTSQLPFSDPAMRIQSWTATVKNGDTVALPTAFGSANYRILMTPSKTSAAGSSAHAVGWVSKSAGSFVATLSWLNDSYSNVGDENTAIPVDITVIGKY